jgi:hypothetical protein
MRAPAIFATLLMVLSLVACGKAEGKGSSGPAAIPSYVPTPTGPNTFTFDADQGAQPVDGKSGTWTAPQSEIQVGEHDGIIKIDSDIDGGRDYIRVELNAPNHEPLSEGRYLDARNRAHTPSNPGILVISKSLGCDDSYGGFIIDLLNRDHAGLLTALDAGFVASCGSATAPALRGRIHYRHP